MRQKGAVDLIAGTALALIGGLAAWHCLMRYPIGFRGRMGSGTFPFACSLLLLFFGLCIVFQGVRRHAESTSGNLRALAFITAGIASFALILERFGLLPGVAASTFLAIMADSWRGWRFTLILSAAMCAAVALIFVVCLSIPFHLLDWNP